MSYSNHTTNYSLPLYVGTDKPTYLGDFNSAMGTIDTQMKANADSASSADSKATQANTNIGTLSSLTTTEKSSLVGAINEVDLNADTAQTTANTASTKADTANTNASKALDEIGKFNLTSFTEYKPSDMTASGCTMQGTITAFTLAKDSTGSIFKLYGTLNVTGTATGNCTITLPNTGITPDSDFTIVGCGIYNQNGTYAITSPSIKVKTNGTMEVSTYVNNGQSGVIRLMACLYFAKDFGDVPQA